MQPEVVFAVYRPKSGRAQALLDLLARHVPTLREEGLASDRPVLLLRERESGALLEIFEWLGPHAADEAHDNPRVMELWNAMGEAADFAPPASLPGMDALFPHFEAVDGIVR